MMRSPARVLLPLCLYAAVEDLFDSGNMPSRAFWPLARFRTLCKEVLMTSWEK